MNHYSYTPLDVGFDPRTQDMPIELPADATSVAFDVDGETRTVEGSRGELINALHEAGYCVVGCATVIVHAASGTDATRMQRAREFIINALHEAGCDVVDYVVDYTNEAKASIVTIETMPDCWRAGHRKANNWGTWPHNGAERRQVTRDEAERIVADDPDGYAHIVEVRHV